MQAVLAARIDRLGEREKEVLQTAAVIGKEFSGADSRSASSRLTTAAIARRACARAAGATAPSSSTRAALYPEVEYAFKHPLTQEVAYRSQLGARRARVHAAVARVIEQLKPDKLDEHAALIAHHWEQAGERADRGAVVSRGRRRRRARQPGRGVAPLGESARDPRACGADPRSPLRCASARRRSC